MSRTFERLMQDFESTFTLNIYDMKYIKRQFLIFGAVSNVSFSKHNFKAHKLITRVGIACSSQVVLVKKKRLKLCEKNLKTLDQLLGN